MDCNKEEAFRAREIAEKKMQNKDFTRAQKIAQKAQRLFPELENISQILTVCEVHCSANFKINGQIDWYGILQVEPTADESSIRKQYRKLALLLHPDKNHFPGAEAAFKLIGEAHKILSDQSKRHIYDMRRNATIKRAPSNQSAPQMGKSSVDGRNFDHQQQQPSQFASSPTFWTICPICCIRYQYYWNLLNKTVYCQNCLKPFVAYNLNAKFVPSGVNLGQSMNNFENLYQQVPPQQTNNVSWQSQSGSVGGRPNIHFEHGGRSANVATNDKVGAGNGVKFETVNPVEMNRGEHIAKPPSANVSSRKVHVESRDSVTTGAKKKNAPQAKHLSPSSISRKSAKIKQKNKYNEKSENDADDFINPHKKMRDESLGGSDEHETGPDADYKSRTNSTLSSDDRIESSHKENIPAEKNVQNPVVRENSEMGSKSRVDYVSNNSPELHTYTYPDTEFFDFENLRHVSEFAVDQIWAVYDNLDGMPRYYARIRYIHFPSFKLRFTWLEHNPLNEAEISWSNADLPVGCGNYILGSSQVTEDRLMFSHIIPCERGKRRRSYSIYPRKGEVWALFKDWNINWSSDAENRLFDYEVVEVLSDFAAETGICVLPLVRIEGSVSLFMETKEKQYVIPPDEVLRFSHNIPSYRLTGTENEGIPPGCIELDPASLPAKFSESFPSINLKEFSHLNSTVDEDKPGISRVQEMENKISQNLFPKDVKSVSDSKQHHGSKNQHSDAWRNSQYDSEQFEVRISQKDYLDAMDTCDENEKLSSMASLSPLVYECPEAKFHNFDEGKSIQNVQKGQIWALYIEEDKYPRYYALVQEVDLVDISVHISWLEACPVFEEEVGWMQESMPITCGTFKAEEHLIVEQFDMFSHLVQPKFARRNRYVILPNCGEIWALYKNWTVGWSYSDLENCEYDVVEICECADVSMKVRLLKKVNGYRAVFKPEIEGKSVTMEIPIDEYTRFSHKVSAFPLTNERGGKLRGFWELDAAFVPETLLLSNSV
ncbi:hypothetical protein Cni_G26622 [Canna indica]|uniref:J domain-containing protein n=1 Tax=Canna indica TaxID=4628 RepID=A0AAQ3L041_9LILI|nr:hypothetical protein Cni_G26622 [Canna indica]